MRTHPARLPLAAICLLAAATTPVLGQEMGGDAMGDAMAGDAPDGLSAVPTDTELRFFESRIRPLLVANCYGCHSLSSGKSKGGLRVDTRDALLSGGESGPAIVPGDPDSSLLVRAVRYLDADYEMPPKGKLRDDEI
ncbi:MAG: hypothetical protein RIS86_2260, partial [Planctomycetota bacterium]